MGESYTDLNAALEDGDRDEWVVALRRVAAACGGVERPIKAGTAPSRLPRAHACGHSIRQARSYVEGLARDDFLAEKKTQQAVILNLMILGEAASQLMAECPEFPDQHPEIPWKQMKGMRNRMAHGYFEIDLTTVVVKIFDNVRAG